MFLLQTYKVHKDSKGAEDPKNAQGYQITDHSPALLNGALINLRIYLEKRCFKEFLWFQIFQPGYVSLLNLYKIGPLRFPFCQYSIWSSSVNLQRVRKVENICISEPLNTVFWLFHAFITFSHLGLSPSSRPMQNDLFLMKLFLERTVSAHIELCHSLNTKINGCSLMPVFCITGENVYSLGYASCFIHSENPAYSAALCAQYGVIIILKVALNIYG